MSIVLSPRDPIFPSVNLPVSGVGVITVATHRGAVILNHTIDVRVPETLRFTTSEVTQIITGLLSGSSFDPQERFGISEETVLHGNYVIEFADKPGMHGTVTVTLHMIPPRIVGGSCCDDSGRCACGDDWQRIQADVVLSEAAFRP